MDQLIATIADGSAAMVSWAAQSGLLFVLFAVIWLAIAIAFVRRHESIDEAWRRIRRLPLGIQVLMWLLLLPVMLGIWIWQRAGWPLVVRAILVLGVAGWNLLVFLPSGAAA